MQLFLSPIFRHWNGLLMLALSYSLDGVAASAAGDESCLSLPEAASIVFTRSERVLIEQTEVGIASEQYQAAKSAKLPTVQGIASISKQDSSAVGRGKEVESLPATAKLSVVQPLYAGGGEYAAERRALLVQQSKEKAAEGARIQVARELISKAYEVVRTQSEWRSAVKFRDLAQKRLREIKGRVAIGRSKSADGLGAEAQVANSEAQVEAAQLALEAAKRQLSFFLGKDASNVCPSPEGTMGAFTSWDQLRQKVLERSDLVALDKTLLAASEQVGIARSGHYPSIDLGGNYYFRRPESQKALGSWDVTLSANVPIYSGGLVSSKVNESLAVERKQSLVVAQAKRDAEEEARELWESFSKSRSRLAFLESAAKKSDQYYQVVTSDERKGLATSLESLQALTSTIDAQRAVEGLKIKIGEMIRQIQLVAGDVEGGLK
jgi:outer membrane protein